MVHIGPENVESNTGRLTNLQTAAELGLFSGKYVFDDSAIIYSKIRPNLNKVALPGFAGICSADMYALWPDAEVLDGGYLLQYMRSPAFVAGATRCSGRTGLPKINREDLAALPVFFPESLGEQRRVAETLATWDKAIETTDCLLARKRKLLSAMAREVIDRVALAHPRRLGDIARSVTRRAGENIARVLTSSGSLGLIDQLEYFNKDVAAEDISDYYMLRRGEFAYNRSTSRGYPYGAIKRLDRYGEAAISTLYLCFELVAEDVVSDFLRELFDSGYMNRQLRMICHAGARSHGLLNVTKSDFFDLMVPVPSIDEQLAITSLLGTARHEVELLEQLKQKYEEQLRGLQQRFFTPPHSARAVG